MRNQNSVLWYRNTNLINEIKEKEGHLDELITDIKSVTQKRQLSDTEKMLLLKKQLVEEKKKNQVLQNQIKAFNNGKA